AAKRLVLPLSPPRSPQTLGRRQPIRYAQPSNPSTPRESAMPMPMNRVTRASVRARARRSAGLTLPETLLVVLMVGVVLALQLPTDAAARRTARRMQSSTQMRGIHQSVVIFGQSNKFY